MVKIIQLSLLTVLLLNNASFSLPPLTEELEKEAHFYIYKNKVNEELFDAGEVQTKEQIEKKYKKGTIAKAEYMAFGEKTYSILYREFNEIKNKHGEFIKLPKKANEICNFSWLSEIPGKGIAVFTRKPYTQEEEINKVVKFLLKIDPSVTHEDALKLAEGMMG